MNRQKQFKICERDFLLEESINNPMAGKRGLVLYTKDNSLSFEEAGYVVCFFENDEKAKEFAIEWHRRVDKECAQCASQRSTEIPS